MATFFLPIWCWKMKMFLRIVTIEIALLNACRINWSRRTDFFVFLAGMRLGAARQQRDDGARRQFGVLKTGEPGMRPWAVHLPTDWQIICILEDDSEIYIWDAGLWSSDLLCVFTEPARIEANKWAGHRSQWASCCYITFTCIHVFVLGH